MQSVENIAGQSVEEIAAVPKEDSTVVRIEEISVGQKDDLTVAKTVEIAAVPSEDFKDARKEDSIVVVPKDESIAERSDEQNDVRKEEEIAVGRKEEEIFVEMKEEPTAELNEERIAEPKGGEISVGQSVVPNAAKDAFEEFAVSNVAEIFDQVRIDFSDASGEEIKKEITDERNDVPNAELIVERNAVHTDWQNSVLTDVPSVVPREDHFCRELFAETV